MIPIYCTFIRLGINVKQFTNSLAPNVKSIQISMSREGVSTFEGSIVNQADTYMGWFIFAVYRSLNLGTRWAAKLLFKQFQYGPI